ncbi:hypothetical protein [Metabacillus sp. RGM 3146]|uniref:hypothetical protein n=1 Tax=Metabacillus sp. RGM 3146 TaxID=3401092 RepID=UPI003B9DB281
MNLYERVCEVYLRVPVGTKSMYVGKQNAGEVWYDMTGNRTDNVSIDANVYGQFSETAALFLFMCKSINKRLQHLQSLFLIR